jgi:membrane-associated protein
VSGYYIGRVLGTTLFTNPNARFLKPKYIEETHAFFEKYGPRALVLARFVPIVRTFITVVAGAGKMDPKKFFVWTGVGAVLWATGLTLLGHALGQFKFIHDHLESAILLIVLISVIPMFVEWLLAKRRNRTAAASAQSEATTPKHAATTNHPTD